jgi:MFS family permease
MGLFVDVSPLRANADFRRYFSTQLVSLFGSMMTVVAMRYQAYKLGGDSTSAVALLALVTLVPFVVSSMVGGAIADAHDKRRVLIVTQLALAGCSLLLALNAAMDRPRLWVLFVVAAISNALVGIDWPTRSATVPNLVPKSDLQSALALMISVFNTATIVGPVLAGFLVKRYTPWLYLGDALTYVVSLAGVLTIAAQPPAGEKRTVSLRTIREGFTYLRGDRTIQSTFVADIVAMVFGAPEALFPAMAEKVFKNTATLGFLQAAPAVGALVAGAFSGWTLRVRRQGWAIIWCIAVWGVGITVFGATRNIGIALAGLFVAGFADAISAIYRSTMVQVLVPDEYRGRLSSIFVAVVRGGPKVGEMESGAAARLGGLQFAGFSGGLACIALIGVVAWRYPELRNYRVEPRVEHDAATTTG